VETMFIDLTNIDYAFVTSQKKQTLLFDEFEKGKIKPEEFISSFKESENLKIKEIDFINAWNAMLLK